MVKCLGRFFILFDEISFTVKWKYEQGYYTLQLFAEGEVNIGEYLPSRRRGKYLPIFTEPKANNRFSIIFRCEHQEV